MADFWQPGAITVLQRLKTRPIDELEGEIENIARRRPIVLLLPALYSEFESASMPLILEELNWSGPCGGFWDRTTSSPTWTASAMPSRGSSR